ncbi:hypothetical protein FACS1894122_11860 [Alphaproteobacteria bacterium]|nr:hypothetical protein FACS1894122_11860 [Alphaproteobacteria bacterium]
MLKDLILSEKTKGTIAIVAAVVMYFTPNYIDAIIQGLLGVYGITELTLREKKKDASSDYD